MEDAPARAVGVWAPRLLALEGVEPPVVVGCSGGADSLALLALASAVGLRPLAVYVDHGLRADTGRDRATVEAAAERLGAGFVVSRVDVAPGPGLEARARDARYAALEHARAAHGASAVLVGHTRDDQAETVLLNLLRGSGTAGLAGMPAARERLRRPLLGLRRADTREICARLRLTPVEDPMNHDTRHRRVWLRREVLPALEGGARRDLVELLARQADVVRDDDALLDALARRAVVPAGAALPVDAVLGTPAPLARRAVRQWLGSPPPSLASVGAVLDVARGSRRAVDLPGGRRVERSGGLLHLVAATPGPRPAPVRWPQPGRAEFGEWAFESWVERAAPVAWPDGRAVAVCDAERVGDEVGVRGVSPGDRFRPVGGRGTRLVHDALAELGVPAARRPARPVVTAPDGAVLWVVGYRIDDRVRVTPRTRRFLWLTSAAGHAA
jgi:tRNA(Ile)-lysidine synthase